MEFDALYLSWRWWFFGEVLLVHAEGTNHLNIEFLAEYDIVLETGLYFKIVFALLVHISEHEHAISDFPLEEGDLLLNTVPNSILPLGIVLLFLGDVLVNQN